MITCFKTRKNSGNKNGGFGRFEKKKGGSPKPEKVDGCAVEDSWSGKKHVYTIFGKPMECCVKCGLENKLVTEWRAGIANGESENFGHPYVVRGYWSLDEYKKAMKQGGMLR